VVIDNRDIMRILPLKPKNQPPLAVDTNAPISGPIARQSFQTVAGRICHFPHVFCHVQRLQLGKLPGREYPAKSGAIFRFARISLFPGLRS
jgi:hypothetical protein